MKLDRLRLRGMSGATDEFTLAAVRFRPYDGWPNLPLKGHRSRDRCVCTKQKTSTKPNNRAAKVTEGPRNHSMW